MALGMLLRGPRTSLLLLLLRGAAAAAATPLEDAAACPEDSAEDAGKPESILLIQRDTRLVFTESLHRTAGVLTWSAAPPWPWPRKQGPALNKSLRFDGKLAVPRSSFDRGEADNWPTIDAVIRRAPGFGVNASQAAARNVQDQLGVSWNSCDDMHTILTSVAFNLFMVTLYLAAFFALRRGFPLVYSYNTLMEPPKAPDAESSHFGWALTLDEVAEASTLDAAMLVEFCNLGMRIAASIGVPLCIVLIPIFSTFGEEDEASLENCPLGASSLHYMSMNSLPSGSRLFWLEAFLVWAVVLVVQACVVRAQERFMVRRANWLKAQAKPRATTLLVSNIPPRYRSDAKLKEYFERLFPNGVVERVYVAKHVDRLMELTSELEHAKQQHHEALYEWKQYNFEPNRQPLIPLYLRNPLEGAATVGAVDFFRKLMSDLEEQISDERKRAVSDNSAFGSEGFVTFCSRRDSEMTLRLNLENSTEFFTMDYPPDPSDVRYSDLLEDPGTRRAKHVLGYVLIALLFISFFPVISGLAFILNLENIRNIGVIQYILVHLPLVQSLLEGVFATLALSLFMGFLPTILRAIISSCFSLKAEALSQYYLQQWYFWFQVVFVLLITAVGSSILQRVSDLTEHPAEVFNILAQNLPYTTRFYIDFTVLQWATNMLNITRYVNLCKFMGLRAVCEEDRAKELAEPEDEDYHGIGSRSARLTLILVVGLVFCTLCPVILIATFCFFFVCRFVYTYLMVFAETEKVDLGGYFWCLQLHHVQLCMPIYIFTMAGVLFHKAAHNGPGIVALSSLLYLGYSYVYQFNALNWENLSFADVAEMERTRPFGADAPEKGCYVQKDLFPEGDDTKMKQLGISGDTPSTRRLEPCLVSLPPG
jgi:hypothetical protein